MLDLKPPAGGTIFFEPAKKIVYLKPPLTQNKNKKMSEIERFLYSAMKGILGMYSYIAFVRFHSDMNQNASSIINELSKMNEKSIPACSKCKKEMK